jgi:hypothetical protein
MVVRSHAWMLRHHAHIIAAAQAPGIDKHDVIARIDAAVDADTSDRTLVLAKLLAPASARIAELERRRDTHLCCAVAALAVERFRLQHGQWPRSLPELVERKLLDAVPLDLYDGQPLCFRRARDGVVIWSVGKDKNYQGDALDNLADFDPARERVEVRLWDVERRGQGR